MPVVEFFVGLVEGKDLPTERGKLEFKAEREATRGLMMWMTNTMFDTGEVVVIGIEFVSLRG